ncbi:hypothetical protein PMAYCL1PPCAC_27256 [Pristionchus mayeri]|uniref:Uncharacterized protein n=1 Tax=Pristionchus mayeri TaxID=1317129 RepID=A0AAN5IBV9_9BILA|nr:hypothetical protein PMAYCL1PPCAC_27256 [Pristionchus mayeri]
MYSTTRKVICGCSLSDQNAIRDSVKLTLPKCINRIKSVFIENVNVSSLNLIRGCLKSIHIDKLTIAIKKDDLEFEYINNDAAELNALHYHSYRLWPLEPLLPLGQPSKDLLMCSAVTAGAIGLVVVANKLFGK